MKKNMAEPLDSHTKASYKPYTKTAVLKCEKKRREEYKKRKRINSTLRKQASSFPLEKIESM